MRRAIAKIGSTFLGLLLLALAGCADSIHHRPGEPPTVAAIERRLNEADAAGDGSPYRLTMRVWYPFSQLSDSEEPVQENFTATVWVDLAHRERRMEIESLTPGRTFVKHYQGGFYLSGLKDEVSLFRDYSERQFAGPGFPFSGLTGPEDQVPFHVVAAGARSFTGSVGDGDENPFELVLDGQGRFERLVSWPSGMPWPQYDLYYEYGEFQMPPFAPSARRGPVGFETGGPLGYEAGRHLPVEIDYAEDAVRAEELEMHFVDEEGNVVRVAPFETPLDEGGFFLEWQDLDDDGLMGPGDSFAFAYPHEGIRPRIYDEWAGHYADEREAFETPGLALPWLFAVALLFAARRGWSRRT